MSDLFQLGTDLDTKLPVVESVEKLTSINSICFGRTGSGKSTLWLLLILQRLMSANVPIIVFDGARWKFLYHILRLMAEGAGRVVKVLFDTDRYQGNKIDLCHQFREFPVSANELASFLFHISNVPYTRAYGVGYFGLASMEAAYDAAEAILKKRRPITLPAVLEKLIEVAGRSRDADQIRASIKMVASHATVRDEDDGSDDFVRWQDVDREKQVLIIPWSAQSVSSSFFASGIHGSLVSHAHLADEMGAPPVRRQIGMDEFQILLGPTFAADLSQQRKFGLGYHLLGQSHFQLEAVDPSLAKVVLDQADWQVHLTVDPFTVEYLQSFSKEVEGSLKNRTVSSTGFSSGTREVKERALGVNDLLEVSSAFGVGLFIRKTQKTFAEPVKLHLQHVINEEIYQHLNSLPFPTRPVPPKSVAPPPSGWRHAPRDKAWERAALELYERRRAWESGA